MQWSSEDFEIPLQNIVLDLDETLIHSFVDGEKIPSVIRDSPEMKGMFFDITVAGGKILVVKRPHLDEFLNYCSDRFDNIAIWSAGIDPYVNEIVKNLRIPKKPYIVYSREKCSQHTEESIDPDGSITRDISHRKPLSILFDKNNSPFSRYNTFIVDDRRDYCKENLLNWMEMPVYSPSIENVGDRSDNYLPLLQNWFECEDVYTSSNVTELIKNEWWDMDCSYPENNL